MNIASPPMNVIILEYSIAISVAMVPITSQIMTTVILNAPNTRGLTPSTTPWMQELGFQCFQN